MSTIAIDCESTGVDLYHGALPFFVTVCREDGTQTFWEWNVDPLTREVEIPDDDFYEIQTLVQETDWIVGQNIKFDVRAFAAIGMDNWPWEKTQDTLMAGHLLHSNGKHNLTDMVIEYLGVDIEPYEIELKKACMKCRDYVRRHLPSWRIAKEGEPDMPSAKGGDDKKADKGVESDKPWKFDTWLPRALVKHWWETSNAYRKWESNHNPAQYISILAQCRRLQGWEYHPPEVCETEIHPYWTVLRDYANPDSASTLALWRVMERLMKERGWWEIYLERMKLLPITFAMEERGITANKGRNEELETEYRRDVKTQETVCLSVASEMGYKLRLACGASLNDNMRTFMTDHLRLEPVYNKKSKTGNQTFNKDAMAHYLATISQDQPGYRFIKALSEKRLRDTNIAYLAGYEKFGIPWMDCGLCYGAGCPYCRDWMVLHPSMNPTGTDTLRWSGSNPNPQNIKKGGIEGGDARSLRYCFGPLPGREWWSLDAKNIELRIPAYEAQEEEFIALFERPDDPPYFGSNHLLISHILHTEKFEECRDDKGQISGAIFKKRYAATLYQWVKNGNFAVLYGAVDKDDGTGTADRAYHMPGAQRRINARLRKMAALNTHWIKFGERNGYVETIPDKSVNPKHGYPIWCSRTEWGKILPTVPLNYHVQGTAMWWTARSMVKVYQQLEDWNKRVENPSRNGYHIALQVHDELVLDFPKRAHPLKNPKLSNLGRIRQVQKLMESCGVDLGIPTPVGIEFHPEHWGSGETV